MINLEKLLEKILDDILSSEEVIIDLGSLDNIAAYLRKIMYKTIKEKGDIKVINELIGKVVHKSSWEQSRQKKSKGKLYRLRLNVYSDRSEINFAEEQVYLIKRKDYDDYVLSSGYYLREEKEQIEFTQAEIDKLGGLADGFVKEEV